MHEIPAWFLIVFAMALIYLLVKIEIDLYSIRSTLWELKDHFIPPNIDDDGV